MWKTKNKFLLTIRSLMISSILLVGATSLSACSHRGIKGVWDFHGEYFFELPFEHTRQFGMFDELPFLTNYSLEDMKQNIINAGYNAMIYDYEGIKRIFIVAEQNGFTSSFVIFDQNFTDSDAFWLTNHRLLVPNGEGIDGKLYYLLFPKHIASTNYDFSKKPLLDIEVFASFEYIVNFYNNNNNGRDAFLINEDTQTITFLANYVSWENLTWEADYLELIYQEIGNRNFISIDFI